ncbi:MAG: universal stress protein [Anaerolineae bacterium]
MFKRILVPLDGSELAERALAQAKHLAVEDSAEIYLLRVYEPEQALAAPVSSLDTYHLVVSVSEVRERAQKYLAKVKATLAGIQVHEIAIESIGNVANVIVEQAAENKIDLVVMSSHGYSGFRRFMMGSVTTETLKRAPCPVLIVPAESAKK